MADENNQIVMRKISDLDESTSLSTGSYTVVSKNGSSYKFDLSKIKADVDLTDVNTKLNEHTEQLGKHSDRLDDLEDKLDGSLKISSIDENTLELENGKLSVIGGSSIGVDEEFVNRKIGEVEDLIDDKADKTHTHGISDVNGLLHDGQEVYQRRIDLTLRKQTVVESINENYKDIQQLQTQLPGKVDKVENMELISIAEKQKLAAIAAGAEVNVQADWNVEDENSDAFIRNKPDFATKAYVDEQIADAVTGGTIDLDGYVTEAELQDELNKKVNSTDLKTVATSGSYTDLTNKPTIPTKTSELTNDSNFLTPTTIPAEYITETVLSGKGYLTEHQSLDDYAKKSDIPTNHVTQNELVEVSGKVATLEASNTTLTGNVATLTGEVTTLKTTVQGIGTTYATKTELTDGLNALHTVATTGKYTDLIDKPTIPTKVSELANDSAFITEAELTGYAKTSDIDTTYAKKQELTDALNLKANSADLATVATSGKYIDLIDTPTIPTTVAQLTDSDAYAKVSNIPTKVSDLTNDSDYVTDAELTGKGYLTQHQSLDAYALKTDIPTVPTKTSELTNDSNFLTTIPSEYITETELTPIKTLLGEETLTTTSQTVTGGVNELKASINGLATVATSGSYNDLIEKPIISVKDFGAVGDGVTDDTNAIQQALEKIEQNNGGTLYFPSGVYSSRYFLLRENLHLYIEPGATLKSQTNVLCSNFLTAETSTQGYDGRSNIIIDGGGIIDMNALSHSQAGTVVQFGHCKNIIVRDITFKNICCDHAIEFCGVDGFIVDNCKFVNYIDTVNDGSKSTKEAIQIDYCGIGHGGGGVQDNTPSKNGIIKNCIFTKDSDEYTHFPAAIGSHGSDTLTNPMENIIIESNVIECVNTYGIVAFYWSNSKIINNIVRGNTTGMGININKTFMSEINNNIIENFTDGVGCYSTSYNIKITNNTINTIQKHGIHYSSASYNGVISNNIITDVNLINETFSAIAVAGVTDTDYVQNVIISNNTIMSNNGGIAYGIDIRPMSKNIAYTNNNFMTTFKTKMINDRQESTSIKTNRTTLFSGDLCTLGTVSFNNSYSLSDFDEYELVFNTNGIESRRFLATELYPKIRTFNMTDSLDTNTINFYEMAINMYENSFEITLNNVQDNVGIASATKSSGVSGTGVHLLKIVGIRYDNQIRL